MKPSTLRRYLIAGACLPAILATAAQAQSTDLRPDPHAVVPATAAEAGAALQDSALPALPDVDIPFTRFVLDNGLTLIVHEDRKAPIVAVNIWYHVGSKNEPLGRSGFAHLFEHLMFNGSENFNSDFFKATELLGATDQNGTTNTDRTNYFQTVPTPALEQTLFLESDRMGYLLGEVGQEVLLWPRLERHHLRHLSGRPPLWPHRHRRDGRSGSGLARGCAGLVPHLLRPGQCRDRAGG